MGCKIFVTEGEKVNLSDLLNYLGEELKIDSLIAEGGTTLLWSLFSEGLVNQVQAYMAPKIFGGKNASTPVSGEGVNAPADAFCFSAPTVTQLGNDLLIECEAI
jgi:diaminohydroxyphosphoribosylaminopyrimidine deaminase/5-amino-6-(5-phosphoribosylamino)uracil reductase